METHTHAPLYLSAPLDLAAAAGDTLPRLFSGVAYSGGLVSDWTTPIVIDLASTDAVDGMPLLYLHDQARDIGTVSVANNDGLSLTVSGDLFSDLDDHARTIAAKAGRGARYQMSVGLFGATAEEVKIGPVDVNGRTLHAPITVLRRGTVREVSIVPLGADRHTSAAFLSALHPEAPMPDPTPDAIADLTAQVADLSAQLTAAMARADLAETALAAQHKTARLTAVLATFAQLGRPIDEAGTAAYLSLPEEAWSQVARDLLASKPVAPAHLFSEQATGEPAGQAAPVINLSAIYAARREVTQ